MVPVLLLSFVLVRPAVPLANATIYLIRHAEKPEEGTGLTPAGEARAAAYVKYFRKDPVDGSTLHLTHIFAAKDSKKSFRPRLTLEPLSKAYHQTLDLRFTDKEPEAIAKELKATSYGDRILISWRHGQIPALLTAMGIKPEKFVPETKWPEDVYDRVIELKFDSQGNFDAAHSKMVQEHLMPGDKK